VMVAVMVPNPDHVFPKSCLRTTDTPHRGPKVLANFVRMLINLDATADIAACNDA
jgi:hypothetical protein